MLSRKTRRARALANSIGYVMEGMERRVMLSGVTIITHGFSDNADGWVRKMGDSISQRPGMEHRSLYTVAVDSDLSVSATRIDGPLPDSSSNPEIVILIDWSKVAGQFAANVQHPLTGYSFSTVDVAQDLAYQFVQSSFLPGLSSPLVDLPMHLIGHSRGGSLVIELAKDLGKSGIWVDQVTTLDPHPVNGTHIVNLSNLGGGILNAPEPDWHDASVSFVSSNVVFADNYYETNSTDNYVTGDPVYEAYSPGPLSLPGGHGAAGYDHNDTHSYYYGTIDQSASATDDLPNPIPATWYTGNNRSTTGFAFSRIAHSSVRPASGMWSQSNRVPVSITSTGADTWDDVLISDFTNDTTAALGSHLSESPTFADGNGDAQITVGLDSDENPYNGFTPDAQTKSATSGISFSVPTTGLTVGKSYYLYAKISNGTHTRYAYALGSVTIDAAVAVDTTPPTASLNYPANSSTVQQAALNNVGSLYVTFSDVGSGFDPSSVLGAGQEFALSGTAAQGVVVSGAPVLVSGNTYQYTFTGTFGTGPVSVNFIAGSWADHAGNHNAASSQTFTVSSTPAASGALQVTISSQSAINAGAQWRLNGGNYQNSGTVISQLAPGNYTVDFKPVTGWVTPPSQSITIVTGLTLTATANYSQQSTTYQLQTVETNGRINRSPAANNYPAGTQVRLTAEPNPGYHFVSWGGDASGTTRALTITMDSNKSITANFAVGDTSRGAVSVTITPQAAVLAGARWRVNGGQWLNSGETVDGLFLGTNYVDFSSVTGFSKPAGRNVDVVGGQTLDVTGAYGGDAQPGYLQVTISPAAAVNTGAQWQVEDGVWRDSAMLMSGLTAGPHTVTFKPIVGWSTPASQTVSVADGQTTLAGGSYTPSTGAPLIFSVGPGNGPIAGGTAVTIEGANFTAPAAVTFGGLPATSVVVQSANRITAVTPARASYGTVSVSVQVPAGTGTNSNGFTYATPRGVNIDLVGQVGGGVEAVAAAGTYVYIGEGSSFVVLNVASPGSPVPVGRITLPGTVKDIAMSGLYAYVADNDGGFQVIDLSNPATPRVSGFYDTPGQARGVAVLGGRAYVADGSSLHVIDVTNPGALTLVSAIDVQGTATEVTVTAGPGGVFAYVTASGSGLKIVDVSNPALPQLRGSQLIDGAATNVAILNNRAYVSGYSGNNAVTIIDVVNPDSPAVLGYYSGAWTNCLTVANGFVYYADSFLHILDATNPQNIFSKGYYDMGISDSRKIAVVGTLAYIAGGQGGFKILNVSIPSSPVLQTSVVTTPGSALEVVGAGSLAYAAGGYDGLQIIDISNPAVPVRRGSVSLGTFVSATGVALGGGRAFVAAGSAGVKVIDVNNPSAPQLLGTYPAYFATGVAYSDGLVFAVGDDNTYHPSLFIMNPANPTAPVLRGSLQLGTSGLSAGIAVRGSFAYVADDVRGLRIIDISNTSAPQLRGTYDTPGSALAVTLTADGNYALVADGSINDGGLRIIDVRNPDAPALVGSFALGMTVYDVAVANGLAFITANSKVIALDLSDPANPIQVGYYDTPGAPSGLSATNDTISVADSNGGLLILKLKDFRPPVITITTPQFQPTLTTTSGTLTLGGGATDDTSVTQVVWANDRGGSGEATGTDDWLATGIVLQPGVNVLTVSAADGAGNTGTDTLTVTYNPVQVGQTITFDALTGKTFGDAPFPLHAISSSGLPVAFSWVSGPATIANGVVTITGAGTVTIRASQAGDNLFNPAANIERSFAIAKANQVLVLGPIENKAFGDDAFEIPGSASSGLPVTYSIVSGPAVVTGSLISFVGSGTVLLRASQPGDSNYNAAADVERTIVVTKAEQVITFGSLTAQLIGDAPFPLFATSSSGLPVSFSLVSGQATLSGNILTLTGVAPITVRAIQPGDGDYNAAAAVDRTFTVSALLLADGNLDGTVGFADLVAVAQNYGTSGKTWIQGDFDGDGNVSFPDLVAVAQNYGKTLGAPLPSIAVGSPSVIATVRAASLPKGKKPAPARPQVVVYPTARSAWLGVFASKPAQRRRIASQLLRD